MVRSSIGNIGNVANNASGAAAGADPFNLVSLIAIMGVVFLTVTALGMVIAVPGIAISLALSYWGPETIEVILSFLPGEFIQNLSLTIKYFNLSWPSTLRIPFLMYFGLAFDLGYWLFFKQDVTGLLRIIGISVLIIHLFFGGFANYNIYQIDVCSNFNYSTPLCQLPLINSFFVQIIYYFYVLALGFYAFTRHFIEIIVQGEGISALFTNLNPLTSPILKFVVSLFSLFILITTYASLIF